MLVVTPEINPMNAAGIRCGWSRTTTGVAADIEPLRRVADELVARLDDIRLAPHRILDHGCRSGRVTQLLQQRYLDAEIVQLGLDQRSLAAARRSRLALVADHRLPLPTGGFDLILSNMAWHWSTDRRALLRSWRRLLRPDGLLLLSTLGSESLPELRQALTTVDQNRCGQAGSRLLPLPALSELGQMMNGSGLRLIVLDRDSVTVSAPSVIGLLRRLRRMGSVNPYHARDRSSYPGRSFWSEVEQCYRAQQGVATPTAAIPVTFELIFGHGWH
ncbi:MAG: methyltransferase domain-containing protein [Magnetococcales bacterium]|nr:methyltransferase domain-containing protein [Magnetococcales bacterium]